ncbi:MAG: tetratricopeptide repeat protein [Patescibacteria group bacterium]|nr:tetratricopeptide repeat protein [Patescibacteria group bacterium]MDD5295230.1 tetratricopeptide repeat protein [Patescibacteria group bacterium]MDD5554889.1 tetratricopeptide repeat protein [Patescibacteria group bacterium]
MKNIFKKIRLNWFKRNFRNFIKHKCKIVLLLIILLFAAQVFTKLNPTLLYTPDASTYLILANSFMPGHEVYHDYSMIGDPVHILYPPMYPLLLTPTALFFGESIFAAKAITGFWAVIMLIGVYLLFRKIGGEKWGLSMAALTAVSPTIIIFSSEVMAEIASLMFAVYSLFFVIKFNNGDGKKYLVFSALAAAGAFLSRSIWVAITPALALYLLFNKKWKSAIIIFVLSIVLMVPWVVRDNLASKATGMGGGSYVEQIMNMDLTPEGPNLAIRFIKRTGVNVNYYYEHLGRMTDTLLVPNSFSPAALSMFFPPFGAKGEQAALILSLCFILFGLIRSLYLNNKTRLIAFAVLCHLGLLMIFPYKEVRYLVPLIPFCLYFLALGAMPVLNLLAWLLSLLVNIKKMKEKFLYILIIASLFIFLIPNWLMNWQSSRMNFYQLIWPGAVKEALAGNYNYEWGSELIGVGKWLRANTPEDSVILQDRKELYFYAQRKIITSEPVTQLTVEEFNLMVWANDINYIIEENFLGKSPLDTKRLGSQQYDVIPEVSVGTLTIFKVKEKLFQEERGDEDYKQVLEVLEKAVADNPGDFAALNNLGVFYLKNDQAELALEQFKKAIELDSATAQIHFNLATAYLDNEKYNEAEAEYNMAKQIQFVHRLVPLIQSNLRIIDILKRAEKTGNKDEKVDLYNQAAIIYYSRGKFSQAKKFLEKALVINPDSALTNTGLGRVYEVLGNYEEALKFYKKAQELDPKDKSITPFNDRTVVAKILRDKKKETIKLGEEEKEIDWEKADSYNILGVLYWSTGEPMRSVAFFKKAIELDDSFYAAYENLGIIYESFGKTEKAKENFQKVAELNPKRSYSKQRLEMLEGAK